MKNKPKVNSENTIRTRFETTLANIEFQGYAMWDDIEKLEHLLSLMKLGKSLDDEFDFVDNVKEIINDD